MSINESPFYPSKTLTQAIIPILSDIANGPKPGFRSRILVINRLSTTRMPPNQPLLAAPHRIPAITPITARNKHCQSVSTWSCCLLQAGSLLHSCPATTSISKKHLIMNQHPPSNYSARKKPQHPYPTRKRRWLSPISSCREVAGWHYIQNGGG